MGDEQLFQNTPSTVQTATVSGTTLSLTWAQQQPTGVSSFTVVLTRISDGAVVQSISVPNTGSVMDENPPTALSIQNVSPGQYSVKVDTTFASGEFLAGTVYSPVVIAEPLPPLTISSVSGLTDNVTISWTASDNVSVKYYKVEVYPFTSGGDAIILQTPSLTLTTSLPAAGNYGFRVKAYDNYGNMWGSSSRVDKPIASPTTTIIFGPSDKSYLELKPAEGDSNIISTTFGSSATIVSRREWTPLPVYPPIYQFSGEPETVNALYSTLNGTYSNDVFYTRAFQVPIKNSDGTSDPTYTPVDLNDVSVAYTSVNNLITGDVFKFEVVGDRFRIVQKGQINQFIGQPIGVTFTIPGFFMRDEVAGKNYVSFLTFTTSITTAELPGPITSLTTAPTAINGQLQLSWAPPDMTGAGTLSDYTLEYTITQDPPLSNITDVVTLQNTATEYIFSGLPSDNPIEIRLYASSSYGLDSSRAALSEYTLAYGYSAPAVKSASVTFPSSVEIQWDQDVSQWEGANGVTSFTIYVYDSGNNATLYASIPNIDPAVKTYTLTNVQPGTYSLTVKTTFIDGGELTSDLLTNIVVPSGAPVITSAAYLGNGEVKVMWSQDVPASSFYVALSQNGVDVINGSALGDETTKLFSDVQPGTYSARVDAIFPDGYQVASTTTSVTVSSPSTPAVTITDASVTGSNVAVTWEYTSRDAMGTISEVSISLTGGASTAYDVPDPDMATAYTISGLADGSYGLLINVTYEGNGISDSWGGSQFIVSAGNSGGIGHNNMATLKYNPPFRADASYSDSVVVYGETAVPRDYPDSLAVVITQAEMNALLSFSKSGEAELDYTSVSVDLSGVSAKVKTELEARLLADHPAIDLAAIGVDARSIKTVTREAWDADVSALDVADVGSVTARNIYEQAADKGKLSATEGKLDMSPSDTFSFYLDTKATQSLSIEIDAADLSGAGQSDVSPFIPSGAPVRGAGETPLFDIATLLGGGTANKGTFTKFWDYKFTVVLSIA